MNQTEQFLTANVGQCLQCLGNTGGWHCDECLPGFYGNPLSGQCKGNETKDASGLFQRIFLL